MTFAGRLRPPTLKERWGDGQKRPFADMGGAMLDTRQ